MEVKLAALVEFLPAPVRGQAQLQADHGEVQALAALREHSVLRLAGQPCHRLPLEGAQLFDERLLGQPPRRKLRHAQVQPKFAPGTHGVEPVVRLSISRARASMVHSFPTIWISSMRTPKRRSMSARSSVELSESM